MIRIVRPERLRCIVLSSKAPGHAIKGQDSLSVCIARAHALSRTSKPFRYIFTSIYFFTHTWVCIDIFIRVTHKTYAYVCIYRYIDT